MAKVIESIKEIKSAGSYQYEKAVINVSEVTGNGRLRGECSLSDGTVFSFSNSVPGLKARIANGGKNPVHIKKESKVTFSAKVDNSQAHGTHKVVSISGNKLSRQHRKVMDALSTINEILGYQDGANMLVQAAWYEYASEQKAIAEAEAKAKAEAEAKAKAESEAKAEAAKVQQIRAEYDTLCSFMPETQAYSLIEKKYGAEYMAKVF